jgi:hypothetical protein
VGAFRAFTFLRVLNLSCTAATLDHACGGGGQSGASLFQKIMPYCSLDLRGTTAQL